MKVALTGKYYEDVKAGTFSLADDIKEYAESVPGILNDVYNPDAFKPEDARSRNVSLQIVDEKLQSKEFKALWEKIEFPDRLYR